MKRRIFYTILAAILCLIPMASKDKNNSNQYEIEMAEIGPIGKMVIKTWCYSSKSRVDDQKFKEYAIKGVLFEGIIDSGRMKGRKPLVEDGYESHKDYFDNFFNNGEYNKYARIALDGYIEQNGIIKIGKKYKIAKMVVVAYSDLRKRLEDDGIIKGLNDGF